MTDLSQLLSELRQLGVRLRLEEGALRCDAPKGAVSVELQQQLRDHKREIIALLRSNRLQDGDDSWRGDAILPDGIAPSVAAKRTGNEPRHVLLTGTTGFLGAYLLVEWLLQSKASIHCLVRAANDAEAQARLKQILTDYGIWDDSHSQRLVVLAGDLAKVQLGLTGERYEELVTTIDMVVHNGAYVHHGLPYASLREANVLGTKELIELACARGIPLHFVSSLSVLPALTAAGEARFLESDALDKVLPPQGGYNLTKWVAEKLIEQAADRGLPVTVYRPGPISGHSETGEFNSNDFLYRLMQGYVESGMAPDGEMPLDLLPVDYASKAIVWLALQGWKAVDQAFERYHLLHPEAASSDRLFDACRKAGFEVARVPYDAWFEHLTAIARAGDQGHALYPLVGLFASRSAQWNASENVTDPVEVPYDATQAQAVLRHAPFEVPPLSTALFDTYVQTMINRGVIQR